MFEWVGAENGTYRFATQVTSKPVALCLRLRHGAPDGAPPGLNLQDAPTRSTLVLSTAEEGTAVYMLRVPGNSGAEEETRITVTADLAAGVPDCHIVLRRTRCVINESLLLDDAAADDLAPEAQKVHQALLASMLWYSFGRFSELTGLKRFTSGKSGSDVLVFRPRLREPDVRDPVLVGARRMEVFSRAWGAPLLIKTGAEVKVRDEWDRFRAFLADRLHPFMSRNEACLTVQPVGFFEESSPTATLIGTFLGGDLLQAEPLQNVIRNTWDPANAEQILERVFSVLDTWYAGGAVETLANWSKMLRPTEVPPASPLTWEIAFVELARQPAAAPRGSLGLKLAGKYNLANAEERREFTEPLMWDIAFVKKDHLVDHLLGKDGHGLLYRLMNLKVRYSLIHGDLQPRNILADPDNTWLIDFGETCIGPTLFDFAKLEVHVRLWCLDVERPTADLEAGAESLEKLLLDHFTATESSLELLRGLAPRLGIAPDALLKAVSCITAIRRHACRYCHEDTPDRREYLAVLYLTVLSTLRYAATDTAPVENFRLLMALYWVLEGILTPMMGMRPYKRGRVPIRPEHLLVPQWLAERGAPGRVFYWLDRQDGQQALAPVAATRGVLQGPSHHLDVLDHTLLVLAYLEEILSDPVAALLDPEALDTRVEESLRQQGIKLPPAAPAGRPAVPVADWLAPLAEEVRQPLERCLDEDIRLMLKWVALFHDVGKPATRVMTQDDGLRGHKVQFLGHQVYGLRLVKTHLEHLFPDQTQYDSVADLILRHHHHHQVIVRFTDARRLATLRQDLEAGIPPRGKRRDDLLKLFQESTAGTSHSFPLLILHGYADMLACRGPATVLPLARVAEIDLALLGLYFRRPMIEHRAAMESEFQRLTKGLVPELNVEFRLDAALKRKLTAHVEDRFLRITCPPGSRGGPVELPTRDELKQWARECLTAQLQGIGDPVG